jgi:2''-aminoglycoside nucleotidyltransferase
MNTAHIPLIHAIFGQADKQNMPLWLESGWAIDARLGKITREHEDIDLAFPQEQEERFMAVLESLGSREIEKTDYGFLVYVGDVLLDCEPCLLHGENYELEDAPSGSCPWQKAGIINGKPVRCTSWEAILWEYFYYREEVPQTAWRPKDFESYAILEQTLGRAKIEELHSVFKSGAG